MVIINLTYDEPTVDQINAGVVNLEPERNRQAKKLLDFKTTPTWKEVKKRAAELADIAYKDIIQRGENPLKTFVLLAGYPHLMAPLEKEIIKKGMTPVYAFYDGTSKEKISPDGTIHKLTIVRHVGFIRVEE